MAEIKMGRVAGLLILLASLSGCVSRYAAPESGPHASLTIETKTNDVINLWAYRYRDLPDGYVCSKKPAEGIAILNNKSFVGTYADGGRDLSRVTVSIPSDDAFRLGFLIPAYTLFTHEIEIKLCQPHILFMPREGSRYLVRHAASGNPCDVEFFELDDESQLIAAEYQKLPLCYDPKNTPAVLEPKIKDLYK